MGNQPEPLIEIGVERRGREIWFFVCDNGSGIDMRYHENIFGLFNKLDANSPGTGLGLALVKRIVEIHGGRIWMESDGEGCGSCFRFTLPGGQDLRESMVGQAPKAAMSGRSGPEV